MESLCDLLFEMSNEDRLSILQRLDEGASNITGLSKALGITNQEVSRHTARLADVGLTREEPEGLHHITHYGRLVLGLLHGIEFASRYRGYFTDHVLAEIPPGLLGRIGKLSAYEYIDSVMVTIHNVERVVREAEEYLLNISSRYPANVIALLQEALERGVTLRSIDQTHNVPHPQMIDIYKDENWLRIIRKARTERRSVDRLMDVVPVNLWMSEKEVAIIAFPREDGSFDFHGFSSRDEGAHRWCRDLFESYWEVAEPGYRTLPPSS
jgi:predicted transcriptional regulator